MRRASSCRAIADPDNISAEFGIVIRSDTKGQQLGPLLMQRIIDYQRSHGMKKLLATVLAENTRMLERVLPANLHEMMPQSR